MLIDCDTCRVRGPGCADCVVTVLLATPAVPLDLDDAERYAVGSLAASGLVPPLRLVTVVNGALPAAQPVRPEDDVQIA